MFVIYNSFISVGSCLIYISNLFLMGMKTVFSTACFFFPGLSVLFRSVHTAQRWNFRTAWWRSRSKASRFGWLEGKLYPVFLQTVFLYDFHVLPHIFALWKYRKLWFLRFSVWGFIVWKFASYPPVVSNPSTQLIVDWKVLRKGI